MGTGTEKNKICRGTLYLTATPIGNLADITDRAKKILSEVDFIAAEDTRNTARLLKSYSITKPLTSYHEHNMRTATPKIIERLQRGEACALVTDAGMPAISDPGEELVRECIENGVPVTVVPGSCAAVSALALSGMSTRRFSFEGFLSGTTKDRRERLEKIKFDDRTLIFYEAPHRLRETLALMRDVLGERETAIVKELTKLNERVLHTTLLRACEFYIEREPRGEYVIIVEGAQAGAERAESFFSDMTVSEHVAFYEKSGMSRMDAMKSTAKDRGVPKGELYKSILAEEKDD